MLIFIVHKIAVLSLPGILCRHIKPPPGLPRGGFKLQPVSDVQAWQKSSICTCNKKSRTCYRCGFLTDVMVLNYLAAGAVVVVVVVVSAGASTFLAFLTFFFLTVFFTSFFSTFTSPAGLVEVVVVSDLTSVLVASAANTTAEKDIATRAATIVDRTFFI